MNIFSLKLLPLYYVLMLSVFFMTTFMNVHTKIIPMEMCSCQQVGQENHTQQSFYVEHVTTDPILFHISEPIRITLKVKNSLDNGSHFNNKWISIYYLEDSSACFAIDDKKTKAMEKRSEYLHKLLQKRMYE